MTPTTTEQTNSTELKTQWTTFDLDSKSEVTLVKTGPFTPVSNMQEFQTRLGGDAAKILEVVNDGLKKYEQDALASNEQIPWKKDEDGKLVDFTGTLISEDKWKLFAANILQMAKLLFGYDTAAAITDNAARVEAKKKAKQQAQDMLLSNPAVIEGLKAK